MTKGAFYHHFQSKDDVLRLIHDRFIDSELSRLHEILATPRAAPQTLRLIMEELTESVELFREEITIFFRERYHLSDEVFADVRRKRDQLEQLVETVIIEGIAAGELRTVDSPRILAFGIIGIGAWSYQWFRPGGRYTGREVGAIYADALLEGIAARAR
jgi:TetR/AcrR family transcriptional regulator, cholesterol catabolism regulator